MKRIKIILLNIILLIFSTNNNLIACYAVIAGKKATTDGSVIVAHAEQNGPPAFLNFTVIPRLTHPANTFVKFYGGGLYPEAQTSFSYLWSQNFGIKGSDGVLNEWGVMCVSDATRTKDTSIEELQSQGELKNGGVVNEIRIEIAKRAKTARQAIHIAADIISKFGYAGKGGTHIIADPNEAWIMTCAGGTRWIAQRVPDDKVVVLPNVNIIREVDLKDTMNFLSSSNIIEYAVKKGWYTPQKDKKFDFKKAYDYIYESPFAKKFNCDARQWRGQSLVTAKTIQLPVGEEGLPFAVSAYKKLSVMDMRNILSDHLEGTDFDLSNLNEANDSSSISINNPEFICNPPKNIADTGIYRDYKYEKGSPHNLMNSIEGMICSKDHQEIGIFQLRNFMPAEIGCIYWRTTAAPCSSVLTPWYLGIDYTPIEYHKNFNIDELVKYDFHFNTPEGTFDYDDTKAFWIFNSVENLVDQKYGKNIAKVRKTYDEFEMKQFADQVEIEKKAIELYKKDKKMARKYLSEYSCGIALQALEKAKTLEKQLKTEILGY